MPTVEDVARSALGSVDSDAGLVLVSRWVNERYRELTTRTRFRHLRRLGEVTLPEPVDDGAITATRGSKIVTGDATAQTAWANTDLVGRFLRVRTSWYKIVDQKAASIVLASEFGEETATAAAYKIYKQHHRLDPRARQLGSFVHMRRRKALDVISQIELDIASPHRHLVTSGPTTVTDFGVDPDGARIVEFYPYSDKVESIRYTYWEMSPELKPHEAMPEVVDVGSLKVGVLCDIYRYEMSKALKKGDFNGAGIWRNELRTQLTEWEGRMAELRRADQGLDDVTLILSLTGPGTPQSTAIVDARDYVLYKWPR